MCVFLLVPTKATVTLQMPLTCFRVPVMLVVMAGAAAGAGGAGSAGFVYQELMCRGGWVGGGGVWVGPQRSRLFKLDFPSAKSWVKIIFGWVGLRAKRPPPPGPLINKAGGVALQCSAPTDAEPSPSAHILHQLWWRTTAGVACGACSRWQGSGRHRGRR